MGEVTLTRVWVKAAKGEVGRVLGGAGGSRPFPRGTRSPRVAFLSAASLVSFSQNTTLHLVLMHPSLLWATPVAQTRLVSDALGSCEERWSSVLQNVPPL